MIYLDNASTTLMKPPQVARAVKKAIATCGGPGRGGHEAAMHAASILFSCREAASKLLGVADPERIVFTMNATHALCIALTSAAPIGGRVIVSGFEHNAVMRPLENLKNRGVTVSVLPTPLFEPEVAYHQFEVALERGADCVICNHVSNVFGYILPVERIGALCEKKGIPFVVDASQSAGCLPIAADKLPHAYWCMPGHKGLYGPQGTGLLVAPEGAKPMPILFGGTGSRSADLLMPDFLPDRLEAGTHNVPGIAGLLAGIDFVMKRGVDSILKRERALASQMIRSLRGYRRVRVRQANHLFCQTGVVSFVVDNMDPECLAGSLGHAGFAVRAGLHCAPCAHRSGETYPVGTVRVSFSDFNTSKEVRLFTKAVKRLIT